MAANMSSNAAAETSTVRHAPVGGTKSKRAGGSSHKENNISCSLVDELDEICLVDPVVAVAVVVVDSREDITHRVQSRDLL
jgi:hypothetical protein